MGSCKFQAQGVRAPVASDDAILPYLLRLAQIHLDDVSSDSLLGDQ